MYVYVPLELLLYTLPFDPHVCSVYTSHKAMKTALNNYVYMDTTTSTCSRSELYMEFEMSCLAVTVTAVMDARSDG